MKVRQCILIIPETWEAEPGRLQVQSQHRQLKETQFQKIKRTRDIDQWQSALGSIFSTAKKFFLKI